MPALKSSCHAVCAHWICMRMVSSKMYLFCAAQRISSLPLRERTRPTSDQRPVFSSLSSGVAECRPLVTDNQIGPLILEDLAFPLRHNNALCAALPVSQAREEGTGRLSHSSHRFLSASLHLLLRSLACPSSPAPKLQTVSCPSAGGKMTAPRASQQDAAGPIFRPKSER